MHMFVLYSLANKVQFLLLDHSTTFLHLKGALRWILEIFLSSAEHSNCF